MDDVNKSQDILLKITKIIETEHVGDADGLLRAGFVLLGVSETCFEDQENRFVYSLGFPKPLSELTHWVKENF